jgi:hypothetical protein
MIASSYTQTRERTSDCAGNTVRRLWWHRSFALTAAHGGGGCTVIRIRMSFILSFEEFFQQPHGPLRNELLPVIFSSGLALLLY